MADEILEPGSIREGQVIRVTATGPLSENARIALNLARLLDHRGEWTEPFPVGTLTCRGADGTWNHRLFAAGQVHPGDNAFQAMTFCGKRAHKIPGTGDVDCPRCVEYLAEDERRAAEAENSAPAVPHLEGDMIVRNWHYK